MLGVADAVANINVVDLMPKAATTSLQWQPDKEWTRQRLAGLAGSSLSIVILPLVKALRLKTTILAKEKRCSKSRWCTCYDCGRGAYRPKQMAMGNDARCQQNVYIQGSLVRVAYCHLLHFPTHCGTVGLLPLEAARLHAVQSL